MGQLSKADIIGISDIRTQIVAVPEWGGEVTIREFTGSERDAFEAALVKTKPDGTREADVQNMRARLCAACIVDPVTGDRIFADADLQQLANKSAVALTRIFRAAQALNGMAPDAVEDAAKNSGGAPSAPSTSG